MLTPSELTDSRLFRYVAAGLIVVKESSARVPSLAIFYRDFGYSTGLIRLGRFDAGIEALDVRGLLKVTIEAIAK